MKVRQEAPGPGTFRSGHFSEQQAAILMQQIIRRGPESGELCLIQFTVMHVYMYILYMYISVYIYIYIHTYIHM